jgi:hypothetical protein
MSMQLTPPVLSNPLAAGYTVPKLPSVASMEAQLQKEAASVLTGSSATTASGATSGTGTATNSATAAFHQLLQQALTKTAQGMASNTARQSGLHPDQSGAPTNGQASTGHAVNIIA